MKLIKQIMIFSLLLGFIFTAFSENLDDYYNKYGSKYKQKNGTSYPIYYMKVKAQGTDIPQVIARMYVPTSKENFVRAIRDWKNYANFLPGQSKKFPTVCEAPKKDGTFVQTALMDLPWPCNDLKYQTLVDPFELSKSKLIETWSNIDLPKEKGFGRTTVNKGSWTISNPGEHDFFLQYEFLVVPSTSVPSSVKAWLADAALEKIIEGIVNRSADRTWTSKKKVRIDYDKKKVKSFDL
ncbi:MAG: hypothetical protein ABIA04_00300 [Pseudomonadota bacterium]